MLYTKEDIMQNLLDLGVDGSGVLLVHSSLRPLGTIQGGAETVLDALIEVMQDGLLILPTHTWRSITVQNPVFNVQKEIPCVGALPTLFLKRPGVVRSLHPTHSVAALGKGAAEYVAGEEKLTTPCGRGGCWGRLYDLQAQILFLGASISRNTFLHAVEEAADVPNRLTAERIPYVVIDGDKVYQVPQQRHISNFTDLSQNFLKMKEPFLYKGYAKQGVVGDGECYLCDAVGMGNLTYDYLQRNIDLFGNAQPVPLSWYMEQS